MRFNLTLTAALNLLIMELIGYTYVIYYTYSKTRAIDVFVPIFIAGLCLPYYWGIASAKE